MELKYVGAKPAISPQRGTNRRQTQYEQTEGFIELTAS